MAELNPNGFVTSGSNYKISKTTSSVNPVSSSNPLRPGPIPATPKGPWSELVLPSSLSTTFVSKVEWTLSGSKSSNVGNEREVSDWIRAAQYSY